MAFLDHIQDKITSDNKLIKIDDDFYNFLNGLTFNTIDFDFIGFYEEKTKKAYIYINQSDPKINTIIYNAWKLFCKNDDIKVKLYGNEFSSYYKFDNYETKRKYLYKYIMEILVNKLFD